MYQPDPDLVAALEDLETGYLELVGKTTPTEKEAIGDFFREALEVFGTPEDVFHEFPDAAGLLYWLRFEAGRSQLVEGLRLVSARSNNPGSPDKANEVSAQKAPDAAQRDEGFEISLHRRRNCNCTATKSD